VAERRHLNASLPIVVDMMGGQHGGSVLFSGILRYLRHFSDKHNRFILVGDSRLLELFSKATPDCYRSRFDHVQAQSAISDDARPAEVLRAGDTDSSMHKALNILASGKARACISVGNSGVLLGLAQKYLGLMPDISRPAICCRIPTEKNSYSYMLDVGGTINLRPTRMVQLAKLITGIDPRKNVSVGLLNIGTADNKGTDDIRATDALLREDSDINYKGFIEGYSLFSGDVDVILCEGFTGNLVLKSIEGSGKYVSTILTRNPLIRMLYPLLRNTLNHLDARRLNGAVLFGLRAPVIKSHSKADAIAFSHAVEFSTKIKWRLEA
jgi:glycerol-3-phosphate acyltransferase PlsX